MSRRAPGDLSQIEDFVNMSDAAAREAFRQEDLARVTEVREALRALLLANNGRELDPAAPATLTAAAGRADLSVSVDAEGQAHLEPRAGGIDGVIGQLLGIVARAQAEGTWYRLKVCPWEDCSHAFYDHSRNHSRTWCSMAVCGNRAKAQTYRRQHA